MIPSTGLRVAALGALTASLLAVTLPASAAPQSNADAASLLAKADHHASMAEAYRARMRTDEKHAISWSTMANHCDRQVRAFRTAALQAPEEPTYRR
jgi:methionyl-tRNA formyltransferase